MTERFIKNLANSRADNIFTAEYYKHVTDSWYLDEKFRFEDLEVEPEGRKPTEEEADIYMKYLCIDEDTIKQLKTIANIFVKKHNEFCKDIENGN